MGGCLSSRRTSSSDLKPLVLIKPSRTISSLSEQRESFHDRYGFSDRILGHGSDAIVYEGIDTLTLDLVAIKVIQLRSSLQLKRQKDLVNNLQRERRILNTLHHPGIIQLLDYHEEPQRYIMILEFGAGGSLYQRIERDGKLQELECLELFKNLCDAIKHMHGLNVVHRDIKPENILLKSSIHLRDVMISDFGYATQSFTDELEDIVGTPHYMAPEVMLGLLYGKAVDVWSLGVTTFVSLSGCFPFESNTDMLTRGVTFDDINWTVISDEAKDFIRKCLIVKKKQRFLMSELVRHPWLRRKEGAVDEEVCFHICSEDTSFSL